MPDWYDLLEQGRRKLAEEREAEAKRVADAAAQRQAELQTTWEPARKAAARDVPPELIPHSNLLEMPGAWSPWTHEFTLVIECPMCAPITGLYNHASGMTGRTWIRCSGDRGLWWVPIYALRCDHQTNGRWEVLEEDQHKVSDLYVALALAEESERLRQDLQDEADAKNAEIDAQQQATATGGPILSPSEQRVAAQLLVAVQSAIGHMVRGDAIAYGEDE